MSKNKRRLPNVTGQTPTIDIRAQTELLNNLTFADYERRMRLLALSAFEWEGLPESCNAEFLEKTLYYYGIAAFVYDNTLGFINTKCTPSESLNIYDIATSYHCYATNYDNTFPLGDIVIVRNNIERYPTSETVELFARRLYEAERACDVNIKGQKTPVLLAADETQRLTIKNVYSGYDGNSPAICVTKNFDPSSIKSIATVAPFVADKIQQYKRNVWNEFLTFIGVNNIETEKKERLTNVEANANNNVVNLSADVMLLTRQQAAREFSEKWDRKITVKRRTFDEIQQSVERGVKNGEVYN